MKNCVLLLFVLFFISCASGIYGSGNVLKSSKWDCIIENITLIETVSEMQIGEEVKICNKHGLAISLENGYIIALTHATKEDEDPVFVETSKNVLIEMKVKMLNEKHYIGEHQIILLGRDNDISLFKTHLPFEGLYFADVSETIVGREVITRGWSLGEGPNVKRGIISATDLVKGNYNSQSGYMPLSFVTTIPTNPGVSGAPVLIYNNRNARYEIIGITWAVIPESKGISFAFTVDAIQDAINKILEKGVE